MSSQAGGSSFRGTGNGKSKDADADMGNGKRKHGDVSSAAFDLLATTRLWAQQSQTINLQSGHHSLI